MATGLAPEAIDHLKHGAAGHSVRGDGGALIFLFDTPEGSLLFQDTSGYWTGMLDMIRPDVAIVAAAGRGNIDGEPVQGTLADFVAKQVATMGPRRVVLSHHDDWLPGFSIATDTSSIRTAIAAAAPGVELLEPGYLAGTEIFA